MRKIIYEDYRQRKTQDRALVDTRVLEKRSETEPVQTTELNQSSFHTVAIELA